MREQKKQWKVSLGVTEKAVISKREAMEIDVKTVKSPTDLLVERKTAYLCCFGIAEHVKILFDESLNKKSQAKQMDIHVRYWGTNGLVHTRYLGSQFLGHATAEDMLQHFQKGIGDLEKQTKNMLQISMDGPNVNWKFLDMITTKIEQDFSVSLINIGSCVLHNVHNAFKTGCQATTWDVSSVLSSMYYLFKDSPTRKEDYQKSSGSTRMPMKFVTHRWMENVPVVDRAIEVWGNIGQFVKDVEKKKIAKPTCKSFEIVSAALKDLSFIAHSNSLRQKAKDKMSLSDKISKKLDEKSSKRRRFGRIQSDQSQEAPNPSNRVQQLEQGLDEQDMDSQKDLFASSPDVLQPEKK
ncbi:hypothetical protein MAR_004830 [Mya arenaria]|uniref:DUF659 domain-containing protein n=1 Tax=Mya arenaria TaxID=6604 RepID=A0ABY7EZB6_MYAAR|nr:hypothetical protein MAR_004830 [Mya arenaria]